MVKEQFAKSIMENRTRDFWSEINRMKNSKAGVWTAWAIPGI